MHRFLCLTISFLIAFCSVSSGQGISPQTTKKQQRIALIIGNGNYTTSVLANPENDAKAMTNVLRNLGFTVYSYQNLDQSQMKKAIDEFGLKLKGNEVGLFYYAGHGIQSSGHNFLVPVDANLNFERQVEYDCIQVDRIMMYMEEAGSSINIIILDACRNNPFEKSWSRSVQGKGLATMNAPTGTLIAYATAPGTTASDGSGKNGLYTSAILESIVNPNFNIIQMFQNVRAIVAQKSGKQQVPWESTSLTGDFYFNPNQVPVLTDQTTIAYLPLVSIAEIPVPEVKDKTSSTAVLKSVVTNDGGAEIVARGFCYSLTPNPTINNTKTLESGGEADFSSSLNGLAPNKTYYARAYAINSAGTAYSPEVSFTTNPGKPVISTEKVIKITSAGAFSGGNITDDGGARILLRGICWSISPNPTILNEKTENGGGLGTFTTPVVVLIPDTVYYLRAYCTNGTETEYGNEVKFRTLRSDQFVDVDDNVYGSETFIYQTWMTENLKTTKFSDGSPIPMVIDKIAWRSQVYPSYCWYDNQEVYKETYGALYNWEAIKSGKLCPFGWHIPIDEDWDLLIQAIGESYAGGYLKEQGMEHWLKPNKGDFSFYNKFMALPSGQRNELGEFRYLGTKGTWWSAYDAKKKASFYREIESASWVLKREKTENNSLGFSVRCVKDQM